MAKKEKMDALVPVEEQPYPVPENWRWVRLAVVSESICDGVHFAPEYVETGIPCYSAKDVYDDAIHDDKCFYICQKDYDDMKKKINVKQGSVLVTKSGSIGRTAVVDKYYEFGLVESIGVVNLRLGQPGYIKRWLDLGFVYSNNLLERHTTGTTIKHLTLRLLSDIAIPFPPLQEQKRILSCIESLFAKLDEAKEKAQAVVDGFEDRKAAILHKAFTGELTEKWRSKKGITIDKWFKGTVKDVCKDIKVGIVIKPSQYYAEKEMGTPAFRSANVREFHIDDFDWVYLNKEGMDLNKRSIVHTGDVLIVRSGNPGTACVVEERFDGYNAIDILIAVPDHNRISSEYLCAFTNSPIGKRLVAENKRGMALAHFNVSGYSQLQIAVPSIEEQNEIMKVIIPILQKEEMIEEEAEKLLIGIDSMKKSILAKAFRGELGTNDPTEPPVDIM